MGHGEDEALGELIDRSHLMDPTRFHDEVAASAAVMGASDPVVFLCDYEQRHLLPLCGAEDEALAIDTTLAGRAFVSGELLDAPHGDRHRLCIPMVDGADRVGVLRLDVAELDDAVRTRCLRFAALATQFVVSNRRFTETLARTTQRRTPSVAAQVQWSQLPPLTFTTRRVAIAGILEPAYDIGGDAFDYSHGDDCTHVVLLDAMGHGLSATWPATLAIGGLRHARQRGLDLTEQYVECSRLLAAQLDPYHFVAAQLARIRCSTGDLEWINAGLPAPLLVRGEKVVGQLDYRASLPLGVGLAASPADVSTLQLEPWDRVLFFTDGVIEGHRPGTDAFGIERLTDLLGREALARAGPAETVRRLAHAVLDHHRHDLRDDFTMLLLEYRGGGEVEAAEHSYHLTDQRTL